MSNNNSTELIAWTREVAALKEDLSRPIDTVSDPRMLELVRAMRNRMADWETVDFTPEELGGLYFDRVGVTLLPAPPIPTPQWGAEREVRSTGDAALEVWDYGRQWGSGETAARLERMTTVVLVADAARGELQGDTRLHEVTLSVWTSLGGIDGGFDAFDLPIERAEELEIVLGDVLHTLSDDEMAGVTYDSGEEFLAALDEGAEA